MSTKAVATPKAATARKASQREGAPREKGPFRRSVQMINRFIEGQRGVFGTAMLLLVAESLTSIGAKLPLGWLLDYLKTGTPQPIADDFAATFAALPPAAVTWVTQFFLGLDLTGMLGFLSAAILLFALLNSASDSFAEIYLAKGGRLLGFHLRDRLYAHLQKLSLAFYSQQRTGDLLTRVTGDVTALEEFAVKSLKDIAGSIFLIVLTLVVLFATNVSMGLIALVSVPILSLASNYFADQIKISAKKQRASEGELAAAAQEMLTSVRVIQTYGSAGDQQQRFAATSRKVLDVALRVGRLNAWFGGVISLLQAVVVVVIVWVSVSLVSVGAIEFGTTVLFILWIQDLFKPTKRIIKQWNEVGKIIASVERINEVLDRRPAVQNEPGAVEAPPFKGQIEYRHVSFAYQPEGEDGQLRLALRDVSFTVAPGEVVALVGGSGAGKSTIAQLLPRLYDPHTGQVLIDGRDIREFTLESLRARMSMVLQETILFSGTVAENIAYGLPHATREEIIAAAIQANAHEFIERLPQGYDTPLSERAANLSGGQRQRIAIARAFIRNTPILILDEPTTGLDAESADLVLHALRTLMKQKSTLIISHDLNLIRHADRILVVQQGVIDQVGTHRELLRAGGLYAELYHKQFGAAVEEDAARQSPAMPPPAVPQEEDEDAEPAPPAVFHTMISQALPAPVSRKAFETILMRSPLLPPDAAQGEQSAAPAAPAPIAEAAPPPPPPRAGERAGGAGLPGPTPTPIAEAAAPSPPPRAGERAGDGIRPAPATVLLRLSPEEMAAAREREVGAPAPASAAPPPPALQLTFDPADSPALGQALPGLAAALDTAAMRDFLQAALFGKLHPQATIVGVKTSDAALLPGGDCLLRYKLELQDGAGQSAELLVTGRIMASQLDCALYMRDRLAPLVALLRGRPALAALRAPAAMLEPLNMVVHAFPIDGDMPTLAAATDPQRMAEVIGEALSAGAEEPLVVEHCHVEVVDYARQGRCTLRYQFEGRQAGAAQPAAQTVYGKVYADDLGAAIVPVVAALRPRALATGVAIPRTLAWRPDLKLALLETLPGEPVIADVLGARLRGKPAPEGALPLEELVERSGQVAAALHGSGVRLGRRRALDNELAALRQELALVRRFAPALATRLDAALQQLDAYAEQSDPLGLRLSHGDFTHGQLIFDGPRVGLVDFDTLCQAEPALDLAQFLVYLRIAARKSDPATSNPLLRQLGERFLGAYLAAAGEAIEDAERLQVRIAVYRVVSLLRRTLRSWQKFKGSRTSHAFTLLEEELACLPQLDS